MTFWRLHKEKLPRLMHYKVNNVLQIGISHSQGRTTHTWIEIRETQDDAVYLCFCQTAFRDQDLSFSFHKRGILQPLTVSTEIAFINPASLRISVFCGLY